MKALDLKVEGIMCDKCIKKVKESLLNKDGIEDAGVSENFKTVTVLFDENKINALQISDLIEKTEDKSFKIIK